MRGIVLTALAAALVFASACSDGPPSDAGGLAPSSCRTGSTCTCFPGYFVGKTVCTPKPNERPVESCDCGECALIEAAPAPTWEPCGGEPFGRWRSTSIDQAGVPLRIVDPGAKRVLAECAANLTFTGLDYRLDIQDGGKAGTSLAAFRSQAEVMGYCLETDRLSCATIPGCAKAPCNRCVCDRQISAEQTSTVWSRSGAKLNIGGTDFDYCVKGSTMLIRDPYVGLLTMKQFIGEGAPTACDTRTATRCAGSGCYLGACEGAGNCAPANSETDCGTRQGCSWNKDRCAGTASGTCQLQDYGVVPGCVAR
jgi:hypothetical protein